MKNIEVGKSEFELLKSGRLKLITSANLNYLESGDVIRVTPSPHMNKTDEIKMEVTHVLHSNLQNGIQQGWCAFSVKPLQGNP